MTKKPQLIVIAGPTAIGKTALAIKLAQHFGTEIISADSRQFFKEMNIGTAKPTKNELESVKHHFINNKSVHQEYDAGGYAVEAEKLLSVLFQTHDRVILVGGSGLYIKALCDGLDEMPTISAEIRSELNLQWQNGYQPDLLEELKQKDPLHFEKVDKNNKQRVIRALEVIRTTGGAYSELRKAKKVKDKFYSTIKIGLECDREELYARINKRMESMISEGLFDEAQSLYTLKELNALRTVGYREVFGFIDGEYDKDEAIRLLKRNSRRYAKRQFTWFKADPAFTWFHRLDEKKIIQYLEDGILDN